MPSTSLRTGNIIIKDDTFCIEAPLRNAAGLQWVRTDGTPNVVRLKLSARPLAVDGDAVAVPGAPIRA